MRGFWKNWMTVWCWGVVAFGALLATVAVPGLDGAARFVFETFNGDKTSVGLFDLPAVKFGLGLQGALTIGWAMTMFAMVGAAQTLGAPLWRALTLSLAAWYVIDSAISVATGFALNAASNTLLMATYLAPVLGSGVLREARLAAA